MKANRRKRDLTRRSDIRLTTIVEGAKMGTTTFPLLKKDKNGDQMLHPNVRYEVRA